MILNEKQISKMKKLLKRKRTVAALMAELDISRKTVYRWINLLSDRGENMYRERGTPARYYIE